MFFTTGHCVDKIGLRNKNFNVIGKDILKCAYKSNSEYIWLYQY